MKTAIWWIRRDLRLSDNTALTAALHQAEVVVPVFIQDPKLAASPKTSLQRLSFMFDGLRSLDIGLHTLGSALILREGDPLEVLHTLKAETGAERIFAEADISPYARSRDARVGRELPLVLTDGVTLHPPTRLLKVDGKPYTVFTPFSRLWRSLPFPGVPLPAPDHMPAVPHLYSAGIPASTGGIDLPAFPAGEVEALARLDAFAADKLFQYAEDRNRMDLDGTSSLSPYLRFGMVSARQAAWSALNAEAKAVCQEARQGAETWLNELAWRDFYAAILYHFPYVREKAFKPDLRSIAWLDDPAGFDAWTAGQTGYPVVDAGMRQLARTGWMHNRARMIVASFLTKDLLINWQRGERYFMQYLLDGDPAANNGGWQWSAGTGTDAAPYFRVFNPVLQGEKYDPLGAYVRRWVPELSAVTDKYIHHPWDMPTEDQKKACCIIGEDYPQPIVNHSMARQRVLAAYKKG